MKNQSFEAHQYKTLMLLQVDEVVQFSSRLYDLVLELQLNSIELSEGSTSFLPSFSAASSELKSSLKSLEEVSGIILCLHPFYVCSFG